jgi:RHS repeat-associated protein
MKNNKSKKPMRCIALLLGAAGLLGAVAEAQAIAVNPGRYTLRGVNSGKCVDVQWASTADAAPLQQYTCNGTAAQQFTVQAATSGNYALVNVNSGKCLDVQWASTAEGAVIQQYTCNGSAAQQFTVQTPAPGRYTFVNVNSAKCLNVAGASLADSAPLQQATCTTAPSQQFAMVAQATPSAVPAAPVASAPVVNYEYDAEGNPTRTIQAPGVAGFDFKTVNTYDPLSRVKDSTDPKLGVTKLEYDGLDRTTKVTDPRNLVTQYPRNGLGDATQLISPDTGTATHTYDAAGNLKTRTDSRGVLATYTYDALNRITGVVYSKSGQTSQTLGWTYDQQGANGNGVGHLTQATHPAGTSQFYFAGTQGLVTSTLQTVNAATGANTAGITKRVDYGYDTAGRVTSITYPSGRQVRVTYADGEPFAISLSKDTTSTAATLITNIQWAPFGGTTGWQWQMASSLKNHVIGYDDSGRMNRYQLGGLYRDLRYDAADRITSYTHILATDGTAQAAFNQTFGYDELGRITNVSAGGSSWTIGYDANGNRTSVTLNGVPSTYNTAPTSNRLDNITNPTRGFLYDEAGNTRQDTGKAFTATYDLSGRMITLAKGGVTTTYTYDTLGRRVRKVSSTGAASTVIFVYGLDGQLLGEYNSAGVALREYVWLGTKPIAMFTPDSANAANPPIAYYIHADHLDTPRIVSDKNDKRRWKWLAEPFGTSAPETNPDALGVFTQNLRFPGQYADSESGLFYNMARYYDSSGARYTQSDPIGLKGGINTFAYVRGNPASYIDPLGLRLVCIIPFGCSYQPDPIPVDPTEPTLPAPSPSLPTIPAVNRSIICQVYPLLCIAPLIPYIIAPPNPGTGNERARCEADAAFDKKERDALCFVAKARGGRFSQMQCLRESDRIYEEDLEKCKKSCP